MRWLPILVLFTGCTCGDVAVQLESAPAESVVVPAATPRGTTAPADPEAARQARIEAARAKVRARIESGLPDHLKEQGVEKFVPQPVDGDPNRSTLSIEIGGTGASITAPKPEEPEAPGGS